MIANGPSRPGGRIGAAHARPWTARNKRPLGTSSTARAAGLCGCMLGIALAAGCDSELPTDMPADAAHSHGLALARGGNSSLAHANPALSKRLTDLRRATAQYHDLDKAKNAGYTTLFVSEPLTAPDGCISDQDLGGMGYHYTRGDNLEDDAVSLLDPEFLVYASKKGPRKNGQERTRLAGFDYFIPYSDVWPGPPATPPTTENFATLRDLPTTEFAPSRFNGWMFHIWLWYHNPDGMFANWNSAVPLCEKSVF